MGRLSGPLLDRIDLHVEVPPLPYRSLSRTSGGEGSDSLRDRVLEARERQARRGMGRNGRLSPEGVRRVCQVASDAEEILETAMTRLSLSARACHRVLKMARTLADLAGREAIVAEDVAEAIQYRSIDATSSGTGRV